MNWKPCVAGGALALLSLSLAAGSLRFDGVLGNSGDFEKPIRFAPSPKDLRGIAIGLVYDEKTGILYERVAPQQLNAYSIDGRQVAQYVLPKYTPRNSDTMVRAGNWLVLMLDAKFYRLRLGAPTGSAVEFLKTEIPLPEYVSATAWKGRLSVSAKGGPIYWLDPETGKSEKWADRGALDLRNNDFDAEGNQIFIHGRNVQKLGADGKFVNNDDWPRTLVGNREGGVDRFRRLGDYWYGGGWNATIKRFNGEFEVAPGVVLGGGGGHFIGYVPANFDAESPRGFAEIRPGLLAFSGMNGTVLLGAWKPEIQRIEILRRIGALPHVGLLEITSDGKVFARQSLWRWTDDAQSPAWLSIRETAELPAAFFDHENFITLGTRYNTTAFFNGKFVEQQMFTNQEKEMPVVKLPIGVAVYRENANGTGMWIFLTFNAKGEARAVQVHPDRNPFRKDLGEVKFSTAAPVTAFSAIRSIAGNYEKLYAAGDNQIIEFVRDGKNWKEQSRWSDGFGTGLEFAVSRNRIVVSDPANNRIVVYSFPGYAKIAEAKVKSPGRVALNGIYVAAYEKDNQRILKFKLEE